MFKKRLGSAPVLMLVTTASACLGIAALPASAVAAPEGVPETLGVQSVSFTTAEVRGAVQLPKNTKYETSAEYALASETWCTTHGASGSPARHLGSVVKSSGEREEFSVHLEALLPEHEYCVAAAVTVAGVTTSGEQKTFTTLPHSPRWFVNGVRATTEHQRFLDFGPTNLHNGYLENLECENFSAGQIWNEVVNGKERGFLQTTGYGTWQCKASKSVKIKNTKGETVEGVFATAEGTPEAKTEKTHKTGSTSLPWTGELTEKEPKKLYVKTHHVKVWVVVPLCTEMGGTGVGPGCTLGGSEIPFEDREGESEKAMGEELEPLMVNGLNSGLDPSKVVFEGEKTEKNGKPETGRLESAVGPGYYQGVLRHAGTTAFELIYAR